jgi:hypothetical protein
MFSLLVSLLMLFTNHSKAVSAPSVGTNDTGKSTCGPHRGLQYQSVRSAGLGWNG